MRGESPIVGRTLICNPTRKRSMFENSRRVFVLLFVLYVFVILLNLDEGNTLLATGWAICGGVLFYGHWRLNSEQTDG